MVNSTCPKCSNTSFELAIEEVKKSSFKIGFIRCTSCGCVVGTTEYYNVGNLVTTLAKKLGYNLE